MDWVCHCGSSIDEPHQVCRTAATSSQHTPDFRIVLSASAQPSVRSIELSKFPAERSAPGITGSWAMCWHFVVDLCKAARRMDLTQGFGVLESPQITFQKSNAVIG
jgi:hypothetical protein